jgi:malonyl-CoA/methylmalonyl-CoA synthetase
MLRPVLPLFSKVVETSTQRALRVGEQSASYAALRSAAARLAARLEALGVSPGERVLVWAHPDLETLLGLSAALLSGRVLVPVNPGIGTQELAHLVRDAGPRLALSSRVDADAPRTPDLACHALALTGAAGAEDPASGAPPALDPDAPCLVLYTSGTTGAPKGAALCARNIAATLDGLKQAWQLSERDTIVHSLPLFHAHGLVFGLFGALRVGACLSLVPKFSTAAMAEALAGESRVLYAVPTLYHRLADAAEHDLALRAALKNARLLVSGSAALPTREHARLAALCDKPVYERYGLSETLINSAARIDRPVRAGYVGTALEGVQIKLVDDARQEIDARDDQTFGEVAVRGPNVFLGYLNRPDATEAVRDRDGWFYTGDLGTLSPDGELRIVGRKATDILKTGGFKVGAGEVEAALLEHPAVREAAVIGAPDPDLGERIIAFVVLREGCEAPTEEALIHSVTTALSKHKRPREVRFVADLPRNAMGKVQKAKLRAAL